MPLVDRVEILFWPVHQLFSTLIHQREITELGDELYAADFH